jgi:hypothetical protein
MSDFKATEKSSLSISLPMLIQAVVGIGALVAMWTSTQADLHALQKDVGQLQDQVKSILEMQDKPIPSDIDQNVRIEFLQEEMERIKTRVYNN